MVVVALVMLKMTLIIPLSHSFKSLSKQRKCDNAKDNLILFQLIHRETEPQSFIA